MDFQEVKFVNNIKELAVFSFAGNYDETIRSLKIVNNVQAYCFNHLHSRNIYTDLKYQNCLKKVRDTYIIAGEQYTLLNKI